MGNRGLARASWCSFRHLRKAPASPHRRRERGKIIRNRTVTVWFGVTTEPGGNVLAQEPVQLFNGYFDSRSGTLTRNGEDQMHDMVLGLGTGPSARSAASVTHSYEAQIAQYPTDTAGRHVQNANKHLYNPQRWPE
jgi:hypothetical protein